MKVIAAIILALTLACTVPSADPTPRPTYTLYPTPTPTLVVSTPTPTIVVSTPTPSPRPTYTPYPTYAPTTQEIEPAPTISPEMFQTVGKTQWFTGETAAALGRGQDAFNQGKYQEAVEAFIETQRIHGIPHPILQNWIGNSYRAMGQRERAIEHYTNVIEIKDEAIDRINRATVFSETHQCEAAIEDSKAALAMEPVAVTGYHTDFAAN